MIGGLQELRSSGYWALRRATEKPKPPCFPVADQPPISTPRLDMHVHVYDIQGMRTTVEINDDQRAALLSIAAERGEKGFSCLVREAIDQYLAGRREQAARVEAALEVKGALDLREAEELMANCVSIRAEWR